MYLIVVVFFLFIKIENFRVLGLEFISGFFDFSNGEICNISLIKYYRDGN